MEEAAVIVASVHRLMNEYRRKLESPAADGSMRFECECDGVECSNSFRMSIDDYDEIRTDGRHFAVHPDHQTSREPVVSTAWSYVVVRKAGASLEFQTVVPNPRLASDLG